MDNSVPSPSQVPAGAPQQPDLLSQAIARVEAVVAQTPNNPVERANQIHAIKQAYIQQMYGTNSMNSQDQ